MATLIDRMRDRPLLSLANQQPGVRRNPVASITPVSATGTTATTTAAPQNRVRDRMDGLLGGAGGIMERLNERRAQRLAEREARQNGNQEAGTPGTDGTNLPAEVQDENDSVADQLTGLLSSDSRYIQLARQAGERQAQTRGLQNSSIAAGASEAAAIAAGMPIASQDADIISRRNQTRLEGDINRRNSLELQGAQDTAALQRLREQIKSNESLSAAERESRMAAIDAEIASRERTSLLNAETSLQTSQIAANSQLTSTYISGLAQLSSNPEIPASERARLIAEYQRVTQQSQAYAQTVSTVPLNYSVQ